MDCQYVMNISQIVENDPGTVHSLRTWGAETGKQNSRLA